MAVRRKGSGNNVGSSITVAAGAINTEEHQAEIEITVNPPRAGVTVPKPQILSGGRGPTNAITATVTMDSTVTDADGKVRGTFTSGHRTEPTVLKIVRDGVSSTATINQRWDDGNWFDYQPFFDFDTPTPVSFQPAFQDRDSAGDEVDVRITGHSMRFVVTGVDVWEWDEGTEDYTLMSHTAEGNGPLIDELTTFNPLIATDNEDGVYTTNLTDHLNLDHILDSVRFDVIDESAHHE